MVCVVNGYVCFSSCDEAKAKQGKDPNAHPNAPPDALDIKKKPGFAGQPAVILDGAVKELANVTALAGVANGPSETTQQPSTDILV
jgi:hypothetical protein